MTGKHIALIRVAAKRLGLDEAQYREVLRTHGGVEHADQLDRAGFGRVMDHLHRCGFVSTWRARTGGQRSGMASSRQVELIRHLWREHHGSDDDRALGRWLERFYGVSALRFVTAAVAGKAITGLRAMVARKQAA